jgi:hypothetical protein
MIGALKILVTEVNMNLNKDGATAKKARVTRPAFVVNCKDCGKVQAASVAEDDSDFEMEKAAGWLRSAARRNRNTARRLEVHEEIPDLAGWCDCKKTRGKKYE